MVRGKVVSRARCSPKRRSGPMDQSFPRYANTFATTSPPDTTAWMCNSSRSLRTTNLTPRRMLQARVLDSLRSVESCVCDNLLLDLVKLTTTALTTALNSMSAGDVCIIFTPDDTHYTIAHEALSRGLHVLVTKPMVHTLEQHIALVELAEEKGVLLGTEVHKRWDPCYGRCAPSYSIRTAAAFVLLIVHVTASLSTGHLPVVGRHLV